MSFLNRSSLNHLFDTFLYNFLKLIWLVSDVICVLRLILNGWQMSMFAVILVSQYLIKSRACTPFWLCLQFQRYLLIIYSKKKRHSLHTFKVIHTHWSVLISNFTVTSNRKIVTEKLYSLAACAGYSVLKDKLPAASPFALVLFLSKVHNAMQVEITYKNFLIYIYDKTHLQISFCFLFLCHCTFMASYTSYVT